MIRKELTTMLMAAAFLGGCAGQATADRSPPRDEIRQMVIREAHSLGFPADLALAVAHAESNFNARALSHRGARGVMQIMPATSRTEYGIDPDRLWNPRVNIRLGIHFLGRLIERYRGRTDIALSHYNGGSAVGVPGSARVIPATRRYVDRVQRLRRLYRRQLSRGLV